MKIATIYTPYKLRAGCELYFEKIIESVSMADSSIKWIILCNKEAHGILSDKFHSSGMELLYVPCLDNQYTKAFWMEFLSKKVVNSLNADCFWDPSGNNYYPGRQWNIPTLTTIHDLGEFQVRNKFGFIRTIFRKYISIPLSIRRSTAFTTISQLTANDMQRFLNIPIENIRIIYNGHSPHEPVMPQCSDRIIGKLGLSPQGYFFTPGRTDYIGKGLDILLAAFRQIRKQGCDKQLVLVGPKGEGHHKLMKELEKDDCSGNIRYLGRVSNEELAALYKHCLSVIISSRFEGFCFPILEAMENEVPIICSDAGALPEIAGDAAYIFRSGDVDGLSTLMQQVLCCDRDTMVSLLQKGKERIKLFSWDKCAENMINEFRKVTGKVRKSNTLSTTL